MLEYTLYDNHFTATDPDDRLARPVDVTRRTKADLIGEITGPGSILKPTETEAVIDNYWGTITEYIRNGEAYSDDYIRTRFGITGVFQNDEDQFDEARHQVVVSVLPKDNVTQAAADIAVRKVDSERIVPEVTSIYDWGSGTEDDVITPGGALIVEGLHLKMYGNVPEEGVFFINQADGTETEATQVRTNEPKTLTLAVPDSLTAGTYRMEVRNTTHHNSDSLRTGIYTPELTVA